MGKLKFFYCLIKTQRSNREIMANKPKPRFAIPSQLDSDEEGDVRPKSSRIDSTEFRPGQLFAQAKKDNAPGAKGDLGKEKTSSTLSSSSSSSKSTTSYSAASNSATTSLPSTA